MNEQEKRDKVIKGLKKVSNDIVDGYIHEPDMVCNAINDALALLKAQEPEAARLLTADEVQHLHDRETICIEQLISRETDERGYITGCGWGVMCNKDNSPGNGLLVSMLGTFFPNTITKIPYEAMYSREDGSGRYTVQFRFWTDRPTNEESKAVKWE